MREYIKKHLQTRDKELYYDFLPSMTEIIERPANILVNIIMYTCFALLFTTIIWACFAKLDISVTASGSISSEDPVNSLLFLVNGTIESVNYKEGDYLKEGDVLCTLVSDANDASVDQYTYRLEVLNIEKELYGKLYEKYQNNDYTSLEVDTSVYGDKSRIADEIVVDNEAFLQSLTLNGYDNQIELQNDQKLKILNKLNEIDEDIKSVTTQLESSKQSLKNTKITASSSGYLTMTNELYPGKTVTAGDSAGYLTDIKDSYYFIAYIPDENVDDLEIGEKVKLNISAFNDTSYDTISGTIKNISDVPITNEDLGVVYKIYIELKHIPEGMKTGMEGNADIVTGTRTVMDYFLEPFKKGLKNSLKEK